MTFSEHILTWYRAHKRELPWRNTTDPYTVWLSEIILQQTRVVQGTPYFLKFIAAFPRVEDLAAASEEEVLKLWQGLGYYSRARNLHATAKYISDELNGRFPETYKGLISLKGVGPYTAAAIGSICFNLPRAVVDGNVYRVLSRYFDVDLPIDSPEGKRYFDNLAHEVMNADQIALYNQGIMEFGALQCVPVSPECDKCPLAASCGARLKKRVGDLPVKQGKTAVRKRYFNYIMPVDQSFRTKLVRRSGPGIWQGLYEFPLVESKGVLDHQNLISEMVGESEMDFLAEGDLIQFNEAPLIHKLSHQHLYTTFWICRLSELPGESVPIEKMGDFPVPVLISNFMETVKNSYF